MAECHVLQIPKNSQRILKKFPKQNPQPLCQFCALLMPLLELQLIIMTWICLRFCFQIECYYHTRDIISRGLYFFTQFSLWLRLILQTIYVLKMEILHFLSSKPAAYKRERLMMARIWYINES